MSPLWRCCKCKRRGKLSKPPREYVRQPKCKSCGHRGWYLDKAQMRKNAQSKCNCGGYEHFHRRGSKWCRHAVGTITAQEAAQRWGGDALDYHWDAHPNISGISINDIGSI